MIEVVDRGYFHREVYVVTGTYPYIHQVKMEELEGCSKELLLVSFQQIHLEGIHTLITGEGSRRKE